MPLDQNTEAATLDSHHHTVDVENPASELKQETAHHHTPPPSIDTSQSTEAFKEIIQAAKFGWRCFVSCCSLILWLYRIWASFPLIFR